MSCGVYILYYETDDFQYYIGKSTNIERRFRDHCRELKNSTHKNKALFEGFIKHGTPSLSILEIVDCIDSLLYTREIFWIKEFDSFNNGMNETIGGEGVGSGEMHPASLYTNDEIINLVKYILKHSKDTLTKVSIALNIDLNTVRAVACGSEHTWLHKEIPDEYIELLSLSGTRVSGLKGELAYSSIYSNEKIIEIMHYLLEGYTAKEVSLQLNVGVQTIYGIFNGRDHTWLKETYPEEYSYMRELYSSTLPIYPLIISPEGTVYTVTNQTDFAKKHNLDQSNLSSVLIGKRKIHKGWKLYTA